MDCMIKFDPSKLHIEEVTCGMCGDTQCTNTNCVNKDKKFNGIQSYADAVKTVFSKKRGVVIPEIRPIDMVPKDNIKFQQTSVGQFSGSDMFEISNILHKFIFGTNTQDSYSKTINKLKMFIESNAEPSLVGSIDSEEEVLEPKIRNSLSFDFDETIVSKLQSVVKKNILSSFDKTVTRIDDIIIHPDHGSLILYNQIGSEFKIHRDKILECPEKDDSGYHYEMYSIIICLDSNIEDRIRSSEGNTIVYLPPINNYNKFRAIDSISKYKCVPHIFNDSVIPTQFLTFPSSARHRSVPLMNKGSYKFILKMDFWVKIYALRGIPMYNIYPFRENNNISYSSQLCNCKKCDPFRQRLPVYYYHNCLSGGIPSDIALHILNFMDFKDLIRYKNIDITKYQSEDHDRLLYEEWDREERYEERFCNGGRSRRRRRR